MFEMPKDFKLLCELRTGSHLYGTNTEHSDVDTRGVFVPTEEYFYGFFKSIEQFEDKETDTVFYELRKFMRLLLNGNPNIVELVFVPKDKTLKTTPEWDMLVENRHLFLSTKARHSFAGYAHSQMERMRNTGKTKNVNRQEARDTYGYDTKFAMHVMRLMFEGEELLTTGELTFPLKQADYLRDVRNGKYMLGDIYLQCADMDWRFEELEKKSVLPKYPDWDGADKLCRQIVRNKLEYDNVKKFCSLMKEQYGE